MTAKEGFISDKDFVPDADPSAAHRFIPDTEFVSDEDRYGGPFGGAKAFLLSAGRHGTLGASDWALTRLGVLSPEEIKAYEETNPTATMAGVPAGIAGSLLLGPESIAAKGAAEALTLAKASGNAAKIAEATQALKTAKNTLKGFEATDLLNPVKTLSRIAGSVTDEVASLLPATSTAGKILSQAGAHGLGSAIEGAAYGLGQSVTEHALGDPDLNAEKVISNMINSALFGGGIGAVFGVSGTAIPAGLKGARRAVGALAEKASDVLPEGLLARASAAVSEKSADDIAPLLQKPFTAEGAALRKNALTGHTERETVAREFTDYLKDASDSISTATRDYYQGPRKEEISKLMGLVPHDRIFNAATELTGGLRSFIKEMRNEPEIYSGVGRIRQAEHIVDALEKKILDSKSAEDVYHALNEAKQQIDPLAKFGKIPNELEAATIQKIKEARQQIRSHLESPAVYGEAGARQASLNNAYSEYTKAQKDLLAVFGKKSASTGLRNLDSGKMMTYLNQVGRPAGDAGNEILQNYIDSAQRLTQQIAESEKNAISKIDTKKLLALFEKTKEYTKATEARFEAVNQFKHLKEAGLGREAIGNAIGVGAAAHLLGAPVLAAEAAYGIYHQLRNPADLVRTLSRVERAVNKMNRAMDTGVKAVFDAAEATRSIRNYGLSKAYADERSEDYEKKTAELLALNDSPEKMIERLENTTAGVAPHAPQIAQGVQGTMIRATQFLRAKIPPKEDLGPFARKYPPSKVELSRWEKYFSVIQDPIGALNQISDGTLTSQTVETLSAVYPKLYDEMKLKLVDALADHIANNRPPIPYSRQLTLSLFLGQDLSTSLKPNNILANQNMLSTATMQKKAAEAGRSAPLQNRASGLSKSDRMLMPMQSSAQRDKI